MLYSIYLCGIYYFKWYIPFTNISYFLFIYKATEKVQLFDTKVHGYTYFGNICNFDKVNQYCCTAKELLGTQQQDDLTNLKNDDIIELISKI